MSFVISISFRLLCFMLVVFALNMTAHSALRLCDEDYDNFFETALNKSKWSIINASAFTHPGDGFLTVSRTSGAAPTATIAALRASTGECIETTMSMESASLFAKGRVKLRGTFYNQQFNVNYRSSMGEVRGEVVIENRFGEMRATASAIVATGIDFRKSKKLFTHVFTTVPNLKKKYNASIYLDKENQSLVFVFNDEKYTHKITTPIYPSNPKKASKELQVNIAGGVGRTIGRFSNVRYNQDLSTKLSQVIVSLLLEQDNERPVMTNPGNQVSVVNEPVNLSVKASDADGDSLVYTASGLPTGLSINSSTGLISGVPTTVGNYNVTVFVDDGTDKVSVKFSWKINTKPELTDPGNQTSRVGDTVSLAIIASDADGDALNYSASGLPAGLSINSSTGLISGVTTTESVYSVSVFVDDGKHAVNEDFTWTVGAGNQPPDLTNPGDQSSRVGDTVSLAIMASDADGDTLEYSASGLPAGLSIDSSSGVITGMPTTVNVYSVTIFVNDGRDTVSENFTWSVGAGNQPPDLTNPGERTSRVGNTVSLWIIATDADGDTLEYSATGLPAGLSIDPASGIISGMPTTVSVNNVTVFVSDGMDTVSEDFIWRVRPANQAPDLTNPGDQSSRVGDTVSLAIMATDADGDTLNYAATGLPAGLSIDSSSGVISGMPSTANVYTVTVFVNDGKDEVSGEFTWTVGAANQPPDLTNPGDQTSVVGDTVSLAIMATDADGDTLEYAATGLPAGLSIDSSSGVISGMPSTANVYNVTVFVNDGRDEVSDGFNWTIDDN